MGKQTSSFSIIGLLLILGIALGLPTIQSWMEQVQIGNISNRVSMVADVGLLMGNTPTAPGLAIATIDQGQDFLCLQVTDQETDRVFYYDTTTRLASLTTCKRG